MNRLDRFPHIEDLRARARRRVPHFAWEYLDSGTGLDRAVTHNRAALDRVRFRQKVLAGKIAPMLGVSLFGQSFDVPFGIAPVGSSGMIWPGAEAALAGLAAKWNLPYTLSTVATREPEEIGPIADGRGWFQLYTPGKDEVRQDLLKRARDAGFSALVVTVDVPLSSRRERQRRAGLTVPPSLGPSSLWQMATCPAWLLSTAQVGIPRFRTLERYIPSRNLADVTRRLAQDLHSQPDWSVMDTIRQDWDGPLILKGIMRPEDAVKAKNEGAEAVWVSNHGGRQTDGAIAAIDALSGVREAVGKGYPLLFDSGVRSGLDIARGLAHGADMVMLGRAFLYGVAALGPAGAEHVAQLLNEDLINTMGQIGVNSPAELRSLLE